MLEQIKRMILFFKKNILKEKSRFKRDFSF